MSFLSSRTVFCLKCLPLVALLLGPRGFAIVDMNFNGLSDSWELAHNGNLLFPPEFDPSADADHDGWINEDEAVAGTDPFDANPGQGIVNPWITRTAATFADTNGDGIFEVITPAVCTLRWESLPGKQYVVEYSPGLGGSAGWLPVGTAIIATQTLQTFNIQTSLPDGTEPPSGFWRVKVTDVDQDGDVLTNHEEWRYGTSRFSRDTENDGVSDFDELTKNFTSPLSAADGDADGIPNDFEKDFARRLLEGKPNPVDWPGVHADLVAGNLDAAHIYTGDGTTAGEMYALVGKAAAHGTASAEFMVEVQMRDNNLSGRYIAPSDVGPGEDNFTYTESAPRGNFPFPLRNTVSLTQPQANASYLTGHIGGAVWNASTKPKTVPISIVTFGASPATSTYREFDNLPDRFECEGSINHLRTRIIATDPSHLGKSISFLRVNSWKPLGDYSFGFGTVLDANLLTVQLAPGHLVSEWIEQAATMRPEEQAFQYLLRLESAPEFLTVNSDFDEGRIDPVTGYAIPDCDDATIGLEAERKHLEGKYALGERVTDDLHAGFFGISPLQAGNDFWTGATVTIGKINKIDPATGHPESGHIRLYGKWGNGPSQYRAIIPYDFDTLATTNLATGGINGVPGERVYGAGSPFPSWTTYYIEGVHPGRITLEWRYQKGAVDVSYEQEFEVVTHKTALQWKYDLDYKIRLETSNDPSGEIRVATLHLPSESYTTRMERASEYYDYYQDCFLSPLRSPPLHPQAMSWPGLARLAGSQVVGGLSDAEYGRQITQYGAFALDPLGLIPSDFLNLEWPEQETADLQQALFTGGRDIFKSIGWQMHAYRSSGYRAIEWAADATGDADATAMVLDDAWINLRLGVLNHDKPLLNGVAELIANREQNVTIVPTWSVVSSLGVLGVVDWVFDHMAKNSCYPLGGDFNDMFPSGNLSDTFDRWDWIKSSTPNGILDTWNSMPEPDRETLVRKTLFADAYRFSLVPLPVYVWDFMDEN